MKRPSVFARTTAAVSLTFFLALQSTAQQVPHRRIVVSIPHRKLAIIENGQTVRTFPVAVGAINSPSPTGEFRIVSRLKDPTYYHPGVVIPAGADNPIGPRWVGLNRNGYGIHGTNEPASIGKAASRGCIRLRNSEMKLLFELVRVGDVVEIHGEYDDEVAAFFDGSLPLNMIGEAGAGQ